MWALRRCGEGRRGQDLVHRGAHGLHDLGREVVEANHDGSVKYGCVGRWGCQRSDISYGLNTKGSRIDTPCGCKHFTRNKPEVDECYAQMSSAWSRRLCLPSKSNGLDAVQVGSLFRNSQMEVSSGLVTGGRATRGALRRKANGVLKVPGKVYRSVAQHSGHFGLDRAARHQVHQPLCPYSAAASIERRCGNIAG